MMRFLLILFIFFSTSVFSQIKERPKIGLTLSGGGAKGLAHIGLLEAIDSAGIQIDYVSGTSMGAIIGGLYSVGYTGKEIEEIVHKVEWDKILTNKPAYDLLILPEKNNAGRYFEIPYKNGKLSLRRGLLESNELWLLLNELFYPYLTTKRFEDLPIPFRCVTADFETGDTVVLKSGNIVKAIRASIAIPGAFTPVEIDGKTLIDGGIAMNFPVSEVKDMGADFVIGSSVTRPLLKSEDFNNPFQIITQLAFYKEEKDFQEQVKSTDFFVDYPIDKYNITSFSSSEEIIKIGIAKGMEILPRLKEIKDSLDLIYGKQKTKAVKKNTTDFYHISKLTTSGLSNEEEKFLISSLDFKSNEDYTAQSISKRIRIVLGARRFRKVTYDILKDDAGTYTLHLDFEKEAKNAIMVGLHYNTDIGIALKLGFSVFGAANPFTATTIRAAIGENPQFNLTNLYFFNKQRTWYLESSVKGEYIETPVYNEDLDKVGLYNQQHLGIEIKANNFMAKNFTVGGGTRFEYLRYAPKIKIPPEIKGNMNLLTTFLDAHFNNLEAPVYPNFGNKVDAELGIDYAVNSSYKFSDESGAIHLPQYTDKSYVTLKYYSAHYLPINKNSLFLKINSGIHFGKKQPLFNDFLIGGNNSVMRNQILFPGFDVNSIYSSSVASSQLGFQYNASNKIVLFAISSFVVYDFVTTNYAIDKNYTDNHTWGFALGAGYKSFLGPIEAVFMYNRINKKISPSFNLGYSMNF